MKEVKDSFMIINYSRYFESLEISIVIHNEEEEAVPELGHSGKCMYLNVFLPYLNLDIVRTNNSRF